MRMRLAAVFGIVLIGYVLAFAGERSALLEFDSDLVRSTFKLQSGNTLGTGFVLLQPLKTSTNLSGYVLITAAHVLNGMPSSNMTVFFRRKEGDDYKKLGREVVIRAYGTNLWVQHPRADVAAIRIALPDNADLGMLSTKLLADDNGFTDFVIHPGDELRVLGYPYGYEANESGFPVLRSGRIASFPLTPAAKNPTYLLDFRVFPGNSGGPVFISENRHMEAGSMNTVQLTAIMGLISEQATISERLTGLTDDMVKKHELGIGIVIHPQLIRETIDRLPELELRSPSAEAKKP